MPPIHACPSRLPPGSAGSRRGRPRSSPQSRTCDCCKGQFPIRGRELQEVRAQVDKGRGRKKEPPRAESVAGPFHLFFLTASPRFTTTADGKFPRGVRGAPKCERLGGEKREAELVDVDAGGAEAGEDELLCEEEAGELPPAKRAPRLLHPVAVKCGPAARADGYTLDSMATYVYPGLLLPSSSSPRGRRP